MVAESKRCALAFFLASVAAFVQQNPIKVQIIAFLLKEETDRLQTKYSSPARKEPLVSQFSTPQLNAWELFRFYATSLLVGRHETAVLEFTTRWPAQYDALADRFLPGHRPKLNPGWT
jgi:hypothetical protein